MGDVYKQESEALRRERKELILATQSLYGYFENFKKTLPPIQQSALAKIMELAK